MMKRIFLLRSLVALVLSIAGISLSQAADPGREEARIEGLIAHVKNLQDAAFVRNGKDYDAATAAKFLRGKWNANRDDIHTAEDFIAKAATKSSTTGKAYMIRFKDGKEVACGPYLAGRLKKK